MNKDYKGGKTAVYTTLGASNHCKDDREENDYYATSPEAIDKLLTKVELPHRIYEPCCGTGHLSKRLEEFGYEVKSSDLIDRGYGEVKDFFEVKSPPWPDNYAIVTNPPYKFAKETVLHALELLPEGGLLCMFLKTTFLEGKKRYNDLFSSQPPVLMLQFIERILCAKNGDFEGMKRTGGSAVAYCWMIWRKGFNGKPQIDWV